MLQKYLETEKEQQKKNFEFFFVILVVLWFENINNRSEEFS